MEIKLIEKIKKARVAEIELKEKYFNILPTSSYNLASNIIHRDIPNKVSQLATLINEASKKAILPIDNDESILTTFFEQKSMILELLANEKFFSPKTQKKESIIVAINTIIRQIDLYCGEFFSFLSSAKLHNKQLLT